MKKLVAFGNHVVVKLVDEVQQSPGGIVLPKEQYNEGRVISTSLEVEKNTKRPVRIGDVVLFKPGYSMVYGENIVVDVDGIIAKVST